MRDIGNIGSDAWKDYIFRNAEEMGVRLLGRELEKITTHCDLLIKWNKINNLTRIIEPVEVADKHVLDSMASLPLIPEGARLIDVGSGGGFPGMVLKILKPSLDVVLVDASRKKVSFLQHVIRTLGFQGISALHRRIEELAEDSIFRNNFDVVVSRSFSALDVFVRDAVHLLSTAGMVIAYKKKEVKDEITELKKMSEMSDFSLDIRPYVLPFMALERVLVILKRKG